MGGFFNNYPYTDFHELNLDWVISKVKELDEKFDFVLDKKLKDFLYKELNDLYVNITYVKEHERLNLYVDSKFFADGEHVYTPSNETMEILDSEG